MTAAIAIEDHVMGAPAIGSLERDSTFLATLFTFSNWDDSGVAAWRWTLVDKPIGSSATLSSGVASTTELTPDVAGAYLVRLRTYTDAGATILDDQDDQLVGIAFPTPEDWQIPAAGETTQRGSRGWATPVEHALRQIRAALPAGDLDIVDNFDSGASAWAIDAQLGGSVKASASGTPFGMPSSGIVLLRATTTAGSKAEIFRKKTGLVLGPNSPIIVRWRFLIADRPADGSIFTLLLGLASPTIANTGVAAAFDITHTTITPGLITQTGGFGVEAFALPPGTYFDVRLTVRETGTTVEIAADGGAYATVLAGANVPSQAVYVPWAKVNRGTANGSGQVVLDLVEIVASRTAPDAGIPAIDDTEPFENVSYTPAVIANWSGTAPASVQDALDRIAAALGPIA